MDIGYGLSVMLQRVAGVVAGPTYILRDEFTTEESSNLSSPRTCEPGPGALTLVTANSSTFEINADGKLEAFVPTAADAFAEVQIYATDALTRAANRAFVIDFDLAAGVGFDPEMFHIQLTTETPPATDASIQTDATYGISIFAGNNFRWQLYGVYTTRNIQVLTDNTQYEVAFITRSAGVFILLDGIMAYATTKGTDATYTPIVAHNVTGAKHDYFRVVDINTDATPILSEVSDSFVRADSTNIGSTDGLGSEEDAVENLVWNEVIGGVQIVSNALVTDNLVSRPNLVVVAPTSEPATQCIESVWNADSSGSRIFTNVMDYKDSSNYREVGVSGTNLYWRETVGGTTFNRRATAHGGISDNSTLYICSSQIFENDYHLFMYSTTDAKQKSDAQAMTGYEGGTGVGLGLFSDNSTKTIGNAYVQSWAAFDSDKTAIDLGTDTDS